MLFKVLVEKMGLPDGVSSMSSSSDKDGLRKLWFLFYYCYFVHNGSLHSIMISLQLTECRLLLHMEQN